MSMCLRRRNWRHLQNFYELLCNEVRHSSRTLYIENNFTKREAYTRTPPFLAKKETCLIKASLLVEISGIEPLTS